LIGQESRRFVVDNVFVIGDVHGHLDRLEALLKQEGLLVRCPTCDGGGMEDGHWSDPDYGLDSVDCTECKGLGVARARKDVTVVQLGDLGHFGSRGSSTGDLLCYKYVTENHWCDVVLWGNHDRALVDRTHAFTDFMHDGQTIHFVRMLHNEGRLQLVFAAHGFLISHAGLAAAFKQQKIDERLKTDLEAFVEWMNDEDEKYLGASMTSPSVDSKELDRQAIGIRDAISYRRGGSGSVGGLLWRDIQENLYDKWRQIFGHSADTKKHMVRACFKDYCQRNLDGAYGCSYCIDVGGKGEQPGDACLAGIWLPSEKIVEVRL
jgi:hypothetical protein